MEKSPGAIQILDSYQLRLPVFEGPLDVLLRLIEREQLPISEVSLIAVFDQFMEFMSSLDSPKPEILAEFAAVAGRLSLLKSRSLLPRPQTLLEQQDDTDLVRQLEAYRALKLATQHLADKQRCGASAFARGESVARPAAQPVRAVPQQPSALERAMKRWLARLPRLPMQVATQRVVSLAEIIARISSLLLTQRSISFDRVREGCDSRQEVAVAFVAVLTLLRRQAIVVNQSEIFGPIQMERPELPMTVVPSLSEADGRHGISTFGE